MTRTGSLDPLYLLTAYESGGDPYMPASNLLSNVWKQSRGAVLAEPFPWTVSQGVILILAIVNSKLLSSDLDFIHANHPVRII